MSKNNKSISNNYLLAILKSLYKYISTVFIFYLLLISLPRVAASSTRSSARALQMTPVPFLLDSLSLALYPNLPQSPIKERLHEFKLADEVMLAYNDKNIGQAKYYGEYLDSFPLLTHPSSYVARAIYYLYFADPVLMERQFDVALGIKIYQELFSKPEEFSDNVNLLLYLDVIENFRQAVRLAPEVHEYRLLYDEMRKNHADFAQHIRYKFNRSAAKSKVPLNSATSHIIQLDKNNGFVDPLISQALHNGYGLVLNSEISRKLFAELGGEDEKLIVFKNNTEYQYYTSRVQSFRFAMEPLNDKQTKKIVYADPDILEKNTLAILTSDGRVLTQIRELQKELPKVTAEKSPQGNAGFGYASEVVVAAVVYYVRRFFIKKNKSKDTDDQFKKTTKAKIVKKNFSKEANQSIVIDDGSVEMTFKQLRKQADVEMATVEKLISGLPDLENDDYGKPKLIIKNAQSVQMNGDDGKLLDKANRLLSLYNSLQIHIAKLKKHRVDINASIDEIASAEKLENNNQSKKILAVAAVIDAELKPLLVATDELAKCFDEAKAKFIEAMDHFDSKSTVQKTAKAWGVKNTAESEGERQRRNNNADKSNFSSEKKATPKSSFLVLERKRVAKSTKGESKEEPKQEYSLRAPKSAFWLEPPRESPTPLTLGLYLPEEAIVETGVENHPIPSDAGPGRSPYFT